MNTYASINKYHSIPNLIFSNPKPFNYFANTINLIKNVENNVVLLTRFFPLLLISKKCASHYNAENPQMKNKFKLWVAMRNWAITAQNLLCSWLNYLNNFKFILLHATTRKRIGRTEKLFSSVSVIMDIRRIIHILRIIALKPHV